MGRGASRGRSNLFRNLRGCSGRSRCTELRSREGRIRQFSLKLRPFPFPTVFRELQLQLPPHHQPAVQQVELPPARRELGEGVGQAQRARSEEHTSELQSPV